MKIAALFWCLLDILPRIGWRKSSVTCESITRRKNELSPFDHHLEILALLSSLYCCFGISKSGWYRWWSREKRTKFRISDLDIEPDIVNALIGLHGFSGNDCVTCFYFLKRKKHLFSSKDSKFNISKCFGSSWEEICRIETFFMQF